MSKQEEFSQVINEFRAMYSGGVAQVLRDSGVPDIEAMPPWTDVKWMGKQVVKCPMDLWVYQEILFETRPDVVFETGTSGGGSAWFFACMMDIIGHGQVVTVDKDSYPVLWREHPRIKYIVGDSASPVVVDEVKLLTAGKSTLVSLDSLHTYEHVKAEMTAYHDLVTHGQYLVVEDVAPGWGHSAVIGDKTWGTDAALEFMVIHPEFTRDHHKERHMLTSNLWLRRS